MRSGGIGWGDVHAGGVESKSLGFAFDAVGGDFLAVPYKRDSGGIADAGDDFVGGANGGVRGGDEHFAVDDLAVGGNGDPGGFGGADYQREREG